MLTIESLTPCLPVHLFAARKFLDITNYSHIHDSAAKKEQQKTLQLALLHQQADLGKRRPTRKDQIGDVQGGATPPRGRLFVTRVGEREGVGGSAARVQGGAAVGSPLRSSKQEGEEERSSLVGPVELSGSPVARSGEWERRGQRRVGKIVIAHWAISKDGAKMHE